MFDLSAPLPTPVAFELPTTPMSLGAGTPVRGPPSPAEKFHHSPSSDAEQYMVEGYGQMANKAGRDQYDQD